MEDYIIKLINDAPIVGICFYIMFRVVRALDRNTSAVESLQNDIRELIIRERIAHK